LRSDHSEKSIYKNQGRKSKPDSFWILFVMSEDVSIGGNGIRFVIQRMRCIDVISILLKYMGCGGIWILLVIYSAKDTIYTLFILCFSSVTGKRPGLTNLRRHCYEQETRTNEPTSPLLRVRDED
jgi:hypothetical protein